MLKESKHIIGIDEAAGPLAGPVVAAAFRFIKKLGGIKDSKLLSEKKRKIVY